MSSFLMEFNLYLEVKCLAPANALYAEGGWMDTVD